MENVVNLDLLKKTYAGKKVFLTGHTGFKGAWLLAVLSELGAEVMGYALAPDTEPSLYGLMQGDSLCTSVTADVRDKSRLEQEMVGFQPDFIFHLAAQSLVRRSYENPLETYEVNVMGTAHVLNAARMLSKPCYIVVITTDKVYENQEWWYPYRENDPLGGYDPYSSSKACTEIAAASWRRSFFNPEAHGQHGKSVATARAGNVIGGGDWAKDRIIPDFIRALGKGETLILRNPDSVRPWEHVLEPLSGYLLLGARMAADPVKYADAFNFGPFAEDNLTVKDLVDKALTIWGNGRYEIQRNENAPHEAKLLRLDISKSMNELGWKPRWHSAEALDATLQWYKQVLLEKKDAHEVTLSQVRQYFSGQGH